MVRCVLLLGALAVAIVLVSGKGDNDLTTMDEAVSFRVHGVVTGRSFDFTFRMPNSALPLTRRKMRYARRRKSSTRRTQTCRRTRPSGTTWI